MAHDEIAENDGRMWKSETPQPLSGATPPAPQMIVVTCPTCKDSVTAVSVNRFAICTDKCCGAVFNIETLPAAPVAVPAGQLNYELVKDRQTLDTFRVEAIDEDGAVYVAIFSGPESEQRATDYAEWITHHKYSVITPQSVRTIKELDSAPAPLPPPQEPTGDSEPKSITQCMWDLVMEFYYQSPPLPGFDARAQQLLDNYVKGLNADAALAGETRTEAHGGCMGCGGTQTRNPHPEAGKMATLLTVGAIWECVPCLVKSRHDWAGRANRAEAALTQAQAERDAAKRELALIDLHRVAAESEVDCQDVEIEELRAEVTKLMEAMKSVIDGYSCIVCCDWCGGKKTGDEGAETIAHEPDCEFVNLARVYEQVKRSL